MTRPAFILGLLGALLTTLMGFGSNAANAFSTDLTYGSVGDVTVPTVVGSNALGSSISVTDPGGLVYASPAHGDINQRVCIHHRLFAFVPATYIENAHWQQVNALVNCYWLAAGAAAVTDGGATFRDLSPLRGYYTDFTVTWKDRPGGRLLGRIRVNHSDPGDYSCSAGSHCRIQKTADGSADIVLDAF